MKLLDSCANTMAFAGLFARPRKNRARQVYELLSTRNNLAESSLYLNLGYWDGAQGYDEACQALAHLLGKAAGLNPSDEVLDAGFGFGDQDLYWMAQFSPKHIVGLNITPSHVELARNRVQERGLEDRIDLRLGSATEIPCDPDTFDKVVSLEAAFHFDTREAFFKEAFRVLRPGGRIALADLIPMPGARQDLATRVGDYLGRSFWQIPKANAYDRKAYAERLRAAGFGGVEVRSIRDQVFPSFVQYARRRLDEPEISRRFHFAVRTFWKASVQDLSAWDGQDYVIATAEKPT